MSSQDEPQSIRSLHARAESARAALSFHPDPRSPSYASSLAAALALYARCREQIALVRLFSPNEAAEDLATSSLPYMLLDLRVAELVQHEPYKPDDDDDEEQQPAAAVSRRRAVVRRARAAYESFLGLVDGYGLVRGRYAKLLERYRDAPGEFAVVVVAGGGGGGGGNMAARRDAKIAAFQAERELKQKLETLRRDPRYRQGDEDDDNDEQGDEDIVRQAHLAAIELGIHAALSGLESLNREVEMLAMAPDRPSLPDSSGGASDPKMRRRYTQDDGGGDTTWRLDQPMMRPGGRRGGGGPLLSDRGRPLQPFTLVGSRADLRAGVFRPGHNLPTMSVDEYLEEERRRGNILSGGTDPARPHVDEDDMEAVDRETYKAREWDAFKDENRRGAGNTMNMG